MIWLTWRHLRAQASAVYGLALGLAIVLAVTGPRLARLSSTDIYDQLKHSDRDLFYAGVVVLAVAPAVIGAFWGAPLVARELEVGTHRLVWNQSVTRSRWLLMKLGMTTLFAAVAVGALSLAITWWSAPIDGATGAAHGSLPMRLTPVAFGMRGLAPVAETVFAVSLGIALGVLLRRALPAMALTLGLMVFVQIAVPLWVRPHLVPATSQSIVISRDTLDGIMGDPGAGVSQITVHTAHHGDWVLSQQTVHNGKSAALPSWFSSCVLPPMPGSGRVARVEQPDLSGCFTRLTTEGYRQHIVYQPVSNFWPLQWAETAFYLVLSALLTLFTFRWVRRLS
jgi:hypothetical protein